MDVARALALNRQHAISETRRRKGGIQDVPLSFSRCQRFGLLAFPFHAAASALTKSEKLVAPVGAADILFSVLRDGWALKASLEEYASLGSLPIQFHPVSGGPVAMPVATRPASS